MLETRAFLSEWCRTSARLLGTMTPITGRLILALRRELPRAIRSDLNRYRETRNR